MGEVERRWEGEGEEVRAMKWDFIKERYTEFKKGKNLQLR